MKKEFWTKTNPKTIYSFSENDLIGNSKKITTNKLLYIQNVDSPLVSEALESEIDHWSVDTIVDNHFEDNYGIDWYSKNIKQSYAVIIDLGKSSYRENYQQFLKCALVAGMAIGSGRRVLVLNSANASKPSDIIKIIKSYSTAKEAKQLVSKFMNSLANDFALINSYTSSLPDSGSQKFKDIDLGEHVAENDTSLLESCFIETPEYYELTKPGYKLFIGRKGTGKSALFLKRVPRAKASRHIIIHQMFDKYNLNDIYDLTLNFVKKNDIDKILAAFWTYIIFSVLSENISRHILNDSALLGKDDYSAEQEFLEKYDSIYADVSESTITERLIFIYDEIARSGVTTVKEIKSKLYSREILGLKKAVMTYLSAADVKLQLNIDGLDSNLTINKNSRIITAVLYNLHDVCSHLFTVDYKNVSINLFVRSDLYDAFSSDISEKDKVKKFYHTWDREILLRMINARFRYNGVDNIIDLLSDSFNIEAFSKKMSKYVFSRPRDYIFIITKMIQIAQSKNLNELNSKIFFDSMDYYTKHLYESIDAEVMTLPFKLQTSTLLNHIKNANNVAEKIPHESLEEIFNRLGLNEEEKMVLLVFLLKSQIIFIYENNAIVRWSKVLEPISKLDVILKSSGRKYLKIHPTIVRILENNF
ncbi:MAG: hypothetical protein K9M55_12050 [Candidatus Marinimicrobia bacterium]|nr:hypothetical protein [Candidatus Neomarinimicrobiota bacterium]